MNKKLRALLERKEKLVKDARAVTDIASAEDRLDLTEEEQTNYDGLMAELDQVNVAIAREQQLIEAERSASAMVLPEGPITGGEPRIDGDLRCGFRNYGQFLQAVARATTEHVVDERLLIGAAAPTTFGSEGVGAEGGFLVPPEFGREIYSISLEEDSFLALTDNDPVAGNSMTYPADETTPWGSTGIIASWEGEGTAATPRKPALEPRTLRANKLICLVPVTDELIADAPALSTYLTRKTAQAIRWKTNDAFVSGDGVGKPLGIKNSGALVSVAKESSQAADTIETANVAKMFARMPGALISRAIWLINNDAFPQLITMTVGNSPIWTPPIGGLQDSPAGRLLGRPIYPSQTCETLGDVGDIYFTSWQAYKTITKRGGIETATSMHLYFDAGATAFRAIFRVGGQPQLRSTITPAKGSNNLSAYVALAERA